MHEYFTACARFHEVIYEEEYAVREIWSVMKNVVTKPCVEVRKDNNKSIASSSL